MFRAAAKKIPVTKVRVPQVAREASTVRCPRFDLVPFLLAICAMESQGVLAFAAEIVCRQ